MGTDQAAVSGRRVGRCAHAATAKAAAPLAGDLAMPVQEVARTSGEPVEARHRQHIAFSKLAEGRGAIGRGRRARRLKTVPPPYLSP